MTWITEAEDKVKAVKASPVETRVSENIDIEVQTAVLQCLNVHVYLAFILLIFILLFFRAYRKMYSSISHP